MTAVGAVPDEAPGGYDLRLGFVAVGVWAAAIAVLYLGFGWGIGIAMLGVVGAGLGLRANRAWLGVLAAVAIGVTAGAMTASAQVAVRDAAPLRSWVAEERVVTAKVVVSDDALLLHGGRRETYRVPARVRWVRAGHTRVSVSARVVVFATDAGRWRWQWVLPGQELTVRGRLSPAEPGTVTAAELAVGEAPKAHGRPPWWQRVAGELRAGLRRACEGLPPEPGGLLPGLALGDVSTMDPGVDGDFRDAGMTHLLAVSGSNVAIVVGAAVLLAAWCGAGRRVRTVIGVAVIIGFVVLVRPSPSVLRAAVMGGLGLLVLSRRGGRDAVPILAAAVTVLLLVDPGLATSLGFVLSVVATAGLVFFASRWTRALTDRGWPRWLATAVAVPVAAQLAVTPVLAAATGAVTPVAVVANAVTVFAVPPATVLTVAATVVWPLWPDAAEVLTWLAAWPARWLVTVAEHAADVPSGSLPWPSGVWPGLLLALVIAAGLLLSRWRAGRRLVAVLVLGVVVGVAPVRILTGGWPPPGWVLIACDVGQGDALLLPTGVESRVIVVDTGPYPRAVDGCLRSVGAERVALLVISHAHADHIGGVTGVYSGRTVEAVLSPRSVGPAADDHDHPAGRQRLAEAVEATPALSVTVGDRLTIGATRLDVLAPDTEFTGTRSDPNNNSLVLRATVGQTTILLSGDVERPAQASLLASGRELRSDVLKVPHHGSAYVEPGFFAAVSPRLAVVSAGRGNDYGHPHPRTLRQLKRQRSAVFRTDRDGDFAVVADDERLAVMTMD